VNLDALVREVSDLRRELEGLKGRLEDLSKAVHPDGTSISRRLQGRGLRIYRKNPQDRLLVSPDLSPEMVTEFYQKMKKYSFRLFLRDFIGTEGAFSPGDLTRYCSGPVAEQYVRFLKKTAVVTPLRGARYRLNRPGVNSFGPTLEWFVAQVFQREFACPALYNVHFRETDAGGDYDVLALWEGRLVYVEVKSSPPKSIEDPEVGAFFSRLHDLIPDTALFFNDTHLRMKDKIVQVFIQEMKNSPDLGLLAQSPEKLSDEIYHLDHRIYILNRRPPKALWGQVLNYQFMMGVGSRFC
jgi:hypothetical protein